MTPKFSSPQDLQRAVDEYFMRCSLYDEPLSITGMCLAMDCTRKTLLAYQHKDRYKAIVERAKLRIEHSYEMRLHTSNKIAGVIFALKQFGWQDVQQRELSGPGGGPMHILVKDIA